MLEIHQELQPVFCRGLCCEVVRMLQPPARGLTCWHCLHTCTRAALSWVMVVGFAAHLHNHCQLA